MPESLQTVIDAAPGLFDELIGRIRRWPTTLGFEPGGLRPALVGDAAAESEAAALTGYHRSWRGR